MVEHTIPVWLVRNRGGSVGIECIGRMMPNKAYLDATVAGALRDGYAVPLSREEIEAQREAVEITGTVSDYTLSGNPKAKTTLPADYVPTVFEEDAKLWQP